jgi:hypothetical protein
MNITRGVLMSPRRYRPRQTIYGPPDTALDVALRHLRTSQLAVRTTQSALATGDDGLGCTLTRAIRELRAAAAILQEYV